MFKKLMGLVGVLLLVSSAMGATYVLTYKDGRTMEVEQLTRVKDVYQVVKAGIKTEIPADEIKSVEKRSTPADEYKERLGKIDKKSADARYRLAKWAEGKELYDVALKELRAALKINPDHDEAKLLKPIVEAKLKAAEADDQGGDNGNGTGAARNDQKKKLDRLLMPTRDVYRLRLLELKRRFNDDGRLVITEAVPITFRNNVLRRFVNAWQGRGIFEQKNGDRRFLAAPNRAQAAYMLEVLPVRSELLDDVIVGSDPKFITDFGRQVWPVVKNILPGAFKEKGVSGLRLIDINSEDPRLIYSNFVLLDGYSKGKWRMIDRRDPDNSLLLNWGLPRDLAKIKNPRENYTPAFRSRKDRQYQRIRRWIAGLESPHPRYNLQYKPPYGNKLDFGGGSGLPPKDSDKDDEEKKDDSADEEKALP